MTVTGASSQRVPLIDVPAEERERTRGVGTVEVKGGALGAARARLPLARVEIAARVAERVAGVTVAETFHNPYAEALEAVYIFPLAGGAAINDFELRVGARVVRGKVDERTEARRQYRRALSEGKRAALLEQERDDVFTVGVGNLPPGEEVTVKVTYSERLPFFEDGTTELRLPLVVAPRYIPGTPLEGASVGDGVEPDTDVVPDASRITPPRLAPGFDPKVALAIEVELLADGEPRDLACSQHAIRTRTRTSLGAAAFKVALAREDEPLDRDFVLRWRLAGDKVQSSLLVARDPAGGPAFAMLAVVPPRREGFLGLARDVVFVLDRSGSMSGVKMASAARACSILLHTLGPRDRFAIVAFDDRLEWLAKPARGPERWVAAGEAGMEDGDRFLRSIGARGGTELDQALGAALGHVAGRADAAGRAPVVVLLTDGQVGDESRVLKRIQKEVGEARVFTIGIDTAVNDAFLKRLANLCGGTSTFVVPGAALEDALAGIGREIGAPLVVDVRLEDDGAGLDPGSIAPARVPDLFAGRATTVFCRLARPRGGALRIRGRRVDGGSVEASTEIAVKAHEIDLPEIAHLWARARVADLEDRYRLEPAEQERLKKEIVDLARRHTLLTRFTAFVAVDEVEVVNEKGERRRVVQPVAMPDRWEVRKGEDEAEATLPAGLTGGVCYALAAPACAAPPPPVVAGGFAEDDDLSVPPGRPARGIASPGGIAGAIAGAIGGAAGAMKDALSGRAKKKTRVMPPSPPTPVERERGIDAGADDAGGVPPAEREAVERAIEAFAKAFESAGAEVDAGRVPPADPLEKARKALLDALAATDLGLAVPKLQRFLRSAAVEVVAALSTPGAGADALRPLLARHAAALADARKEAAAALGAAAGGPRGGAFWEGTV